MKRSTQLINALVISTALTSLALLTSCGKESNDTTNATPPTTQNDPLGNMAEDLKDTAKEMSDELKQATQKFYDQFKNNLAGYQTQLADLQDRASALDDDKLNKMVANIEKKITTSQATLKTYLTTGSDSDKSTLNTLVEDTKKLIDRALTRADELEGS